MECLLENVHPNGAPEPVNVRIADGKFASLDDRDPPGDATILRGGGLWLLPGMVDAHVHLNEPGRTEWEGWTSGTHAAALGGVTTLAEMPLNAIPPTNTAEAFALKLAAAKDKARVDFALWGGLVPDNLEHLSALADCGVIGFKAFMSPSGTDDFAHSDARTLKAGMERITPLGLPLALHAEAPLVLERETAANHPRTARGFEAARPREAELTAIRTALDLAGETGCRVHIVHVSCPEGVDLIADYRERGVCVTCETCTHYLTLTLDDVERLGAVAKCAPPIRTPDALPALWERLRDGLIQTVGSDHSPAPSELKTGDYIEAWGGISGLQHAYSLLLDAHLDANRSSVLRLCEVCCMEPAHLLGLADRKGSLAPGKDADAVLFDPAAQTVVATEALAYRHPHAPYVGRTLKGAVCHVLLRGWKIVQDGQSVGVPAGRLLKPSF
ncbi:MAG: allantoinase AllB [Opitutales bacterium]